MESSGQPTESKAARYLRTRSNEGYLFADPSWTRPMYKALFA